MPMLDRLSTASCSSNACLCAETQPIEPSANIAADFKHIATAIDPSRCGLRASARHREQERCIRLGAMPGLVVLLRSEALQGPPFATSTQ